MHLKWILSYGCTDKCLVFYYGKQGVYNRYFKSAWNQNWIEFQHFPIEYPVLGIILQKYNAVSCWLKCAYYNADNSRKVNYQFKL